MKHYLNRLCALVGMFALGTAGIEAQSAAKVPIAIAGFETTGSVGLGDEDYSALARALAVVFSTELGNRTAADIVPIQVPVAAKSGKIDMAVARSAATRAGVKFLVLGSYLDQYSEIHIETRIIDATTGATVANIRSDPKFKDRNQIVEALIDVANKIGAQPVVGGAKSATGRGKVPGDALVELGKGLLREESGKKSEAAESFRKALKAAPDFTEATQALQRVGGH